MVYNLLICFFTKKQRINRKIQRHNIYIKLKKFGFPIIWHIDPI